MRLNGQKIGRNDPCICGSGIKFKKCHGAQTAEQRRTARRQKIATVLRDVRAIADGVRGSSPLSAPVK
jgi:hypothetical protein